MDYFELLLKAPLVDHTNLNTVHEIQRRLEGQGWSVPNIINDQGKKLWIIEIGSTGVFIGYCDDLGHWITESDDVCPSYPFMVKTITKEELGEV